MILWFLLISNQYVHKIVANFRNNTSPGSTILGLLYCISCIIITQRTNSKYKAINYLHSLALYNTEEYICNIFRQMHISEECAQCSSVLKCSLSYL